MATHPRLLRVESIEDRLAPATMTMMQMGYANPIYGSYYASHARADLFANERSINTARDYGVGTFYSPRSELFAVTSSYGRPMLVDIIIWQGDWNTVIQVLPVPAPSPVTYGDPSSTPDTSTPSSSGGARPVTHPTTTPVSTGGDSVTDPSAASQSSTVSIPAGAANRTPAEGTATTNSGAEQGNRALVQNIPAIAFQSRPDFAHLSVPVVTNVELADVNSSSAAPAVPQSEEPPLAQEDPPAAVPESGPTGTPTPIAAAVEPLAGMFPFNLTAIETGVRGVLDHVAGLEKTWTEGPAGAEDYLWLAAGALVAGGVAQAAWTRRIRPTDPRTLGLDSVLARWGEKYVG
jgi:hypothetical protein